VKFRLFNTEEVVRKGDSCGYDQQGALEPRSKTIERTVLSVDHKFKSRIHALRNYVIAVGHF